MKVDGNKSICWKKIIMSVFNGVGNIVANGKNAGYQRCLIFPQSFLKLSLSVCWMLKVGTMW